MTNVNGMAGLLVNLLDSQIETGKYGIMEGGRIRKALTIGPFFTDTEQRLLLLSPVARMDYKRIRKEIHQDVIDRLDGLQVERQLLPLAADSEEDTIIMKNNGFTVTLYRREDMDIAWIILVQLGPSYLEAINPMTRLRLYDSGGLEWIRGKPDVNGEMTSFWNDIETDLLTRSRRFSLCLEPV
jgi:hypothetical protein